MNSTEFAVDPIESQRPRREVEWEFSLPKASEVELPKVNLEPARKAAEQMLLTGIGAGVLLTRAVVGAVKAANKAGSEAAEHHGSAAETLLKFVRKPEQSSETKPESSQGMTVPVLPIANYNQVSTSQIIATLPELSQEQLRTLRDYEAEHKGRTAVLKAIDGYLASA